MNFGELKAYVLADAHAPELADDVAGFIARGEDFLASKLRSTEQDATTTLDDTHRSGPESGIYTLPAGVLELRRLSIGGDLPLSEVSAYAVRRLRGSARPRHYAVLGRRIEVRGIPGEGAEIELEYWGRLERLTDDADTNVILTNHRNLYIHAAKFYLYQRLQERELAQDELSALIDAIDSVNEETGRKLGGAVAAPAYDFGAGGSY